MKEVLVKHPLATRFPFLHRNRCFGSARTFLPVCREESADKSSYE
jgi:hypothetical protein